MNIREYLQENKKLTDEALDTYIPLLDGHNSTIHKAMRYSLLCGGKRLRPILAIASCEAVGGNTSNVLPFACALEMIHTYSLIHDDLPAMDDDDYRRGNLTNHKVFGEGAAILAGNALLTEAFRIMTSSKVLSALDQKIVLEVINDIAGATGPSGMIGGQIVDLESEGKEASLSDLEFIHAHKTGDLITASVTTGTKLGGGTKKEIELLSQYGRAVGLLFQIVDDILDIEGEEEVLGKSVGSDANKKKVTFPGILGIDDSKKNADELVVKAIGFLKQFDDKAEPLRMIARHIRDRKG